MKLLGNSVIYTGVSLLQKAVGFFLLPVYTTFLTAADYGRANVVLAVANFLSLFYLLALNGAGTRFEHKYHLDPEKAREIWGTLLIAVCVNSAVLSVLFVLAGERLLQPFLGEIPFRPYMQLGLLAIAFYPPYILFQAYLQARQMGVRFGLNNFCYFLLNMSLTLLFVAVFRMKAESILLALAITNAAAFAYTLVDFPHRVSLRFRLVHFRESLAYTLPLIPHSLAGWAMNLVDRLFLGHFRNLSSVGVYVIGGQLGNLVNVLTVSVNQAFVPWFFEMCEEGEQGRRQVARVSGALVLAYGICALALSLFSPEVLVLMVTEEFRGAWRVVPLLSFAFVFSGVYYVFVNPLFIKHTVLVPVATLSSAGLGLLLNWLLIPRFGMYGAAAANLLTQFAASAVALVLSSRFGPVRYDWIRIYAFALAPFALSQIVYLQGSMHPAALFALKSGALLAGLAAAVGLYFRESKAAWEKLHGKLRSRRG